MPSRVSRCRRRFWNRCAVTCRRCTASTSPASAATSIAMATTAWHGMVTGWRANRPSRSSQQSAWGRLVRFFFAPSAAGPLTPICSVMAISSSWVGDVKSSGNIRSRKLLVPAQESALCSGLANVSTLALFTRLGRREIARNRHNCATESLLNVITVVRGVRVLRHPDQRKGVPHDHDVSSSCSSHVSRHADALRSNPGCCARRELRSASPGACTPATPRVVVHLIDSEGAHASERLRIFVAM